MTYYGVLSLMQHQAEASGSRSRISLDGLDPDRDLT
jgi:hypothetical protein